MKNKGFTLIELLAVIVILAIIALIATPIILGIISDARTQARKRSAELVYKGVEYAYTQTIVTSVNGTDFTLTDLNNKLKIENVTSTTVNNDTIEIVTKDGVYCGVTKNTSTNSIDVVCGTDDEDFTQDDVMETKSILYSAAQNSETSELNFKPQYYSRNTSTLNIGDDLPSDKTTNPSTFASDFYLGYDGNASGKITAEYVCFVTDKEYCLKGGGATIENSVVVTPSPYYDKNVRILFAAFGEEACNLGEVSSLNRYSYRCGGSSFEAVAYNTGYVGANMGYAHCNVETFGSECN